MASDGQGHQHARSFVETCRASLSVVEWLQDSEHVDEEEEEGEGPPSDYTDEGILVTALESFSDLRLISRLTPATGGSQQSHPIMFFFSRNYDVNACVHLLSEPSLRRGVVQWFVFLGSTSKIGKHLQCLQTGTEPDNSEQAVPDTSGVLTLAAATTASNGPSAVAAYAEQLDGQPSRTPSDTRRSEQVTVLLPNPGPPKPGKPLMLLSCLMAEVPSTECKQYSSEMLPTWLWQLTCPTASQTCSAPRPQESA